MSCFLFRMLTCFAVLSAGCYTHAQNSIEIPQAPEPHTTQLKSRPARTPAQQKEALRLSNLPLVNGAPYDQPSVRDLSLYYVHDTYLVNGQVGDTLRALYSQVRGTPHYWGFPQRFGSAEGVNAINGTVRLGMEMTFHEDLRYLPCIHCSFKRKVANALLSEVTARHGEDGRRIFSLTPAISDFSGPIIAHCLWYRSVDPFAGVISTRVVAVIRVGEHVGLEMWVDRHHKHELK